MQTVSSEWKTAHKGLLVPESFVEVKMVVTDPAAFASAQATSNGEEAFSNVAEVVRDIEKDPQKYATLEKNIWILDGSVSLLPEASKRGKNGYIGTAICDENGVYSVKPTITISFGQVFTSVIPGITITWASAYNEWAQDFTVTAYNGSTVVGKMVVTDNTELESVVFFDISGYDRIVITVDKWCLPYRRARVEHIIVGIKKIYTKSEIINYTHNITVDPLSASLPKAEIVFEIVNLNGEYNPDNPRGAEKYLMERQMVTARYGYKLNGELEWIDAGTFFMSEWETPQNGITATFTARDSLEYMTDTYTGTSTGTLMDIAKAAMEQAQLPVLQTDGSNRWYLHSSLNGITVPSDLDLSANSIMEVLQYVANAACCVFYQDRTGVLRIEPLPVGKTDYIIDQFVSYANAEISLTKQLKAVDMNDGQYILTVGEVGETQKVTNPLVTNKRAPMVAQWTADYLVKRKVLTGDYRADPRLDALDRITTENQFAKNTVLVTDLTYTYNGAFRGSYEGRAD